MTIKSKLATFKEALNGGQQDYTTLHIRRALLMLAIPMILEMVMESIFALVDVYFVGKLGTDEVAAVGLTEPVLMMVYSIALGIAMAASAMVARRVGEKELDRASIAAGQIIYLGLGLSIVISGLGLIFAPDILQMMGATDTVVALGTPYMRWLLGSNVVIVLLFLLNAIFRGAGNAQITLRALTIANGLNIVLDPLLIFGIGPLPAMGLEGAAIATIIGRGTGVIYLCYHLFNGTGLLKVTLAHMRIHWDVIKRLVDVAVGGAGQFLISSASWMFIVRIVSEFEEEAVAGYTFAVRVIIFTILPAFGLANAAATMVGQNLGADRPDRAEKAVWLAAFYNFVFLGFISVIFYVFALDILSFFSQDEKVIYYGVQCLQIICFGYMAFAYGMVLGLAFNGAGDTKTPTRVNLVAFWLIQIPLAYMLAIELQYGPAGVFVAIAVSQSLLALINIVLFRQGRWKGTAI
ncbi:MAG: MATE family efflux transporter [Flavobacteriales bacterium]|nr:MATE family efflux transporter [Flavobacteriales bacterium]